MCAPKPPQQTPQQILGAPAPVEFPSIQTADNLIVGGPSHGAAQLGRLQLRLGSGVPLARSATASSGQAPNPPAAIAASAPSTQGAGAYAFNPGSALTNLRFTPGGVGGF